VFYLFSSLASVAQHITMVKQQVEISLHGQPRPAAIFNTIRLRNICTFSAVVGSQEWSLKCKVMFADSNAV
jgi:hypothetical protein